MSVGIKIVIYWCLLILQEPPCKLAEENFHLICFRVRILSCLWRLYYAYFMFYVFCILYFLFRFIMMPAGDCLVCSYICNLMIITITAPTQNEIPEHKIKMFVFTISVLVCQWCVILWTITYLTVSSWLCYKLISLFPN